MLKTHHLFFSIFRQRLRDREHLFSRRRGRACR